MNFSCSSKESSLVNNGLGTLLDPSSENIVETGTGVGVNWTGLKEVTLAGISSWISGIKGTPVVKIDPSDKGGKSCEVVNIGGNSVVGFGEKKPVEVEKISLSKISFESGENVVGWKWVDGVVMKLEPLCFTSIPDRKVVVGNGNGVDETTVTVEDVGLNVPGPEIEKLLSLKNKECNF